MNKILKVGIAGYGIVGKRRKFFIEKNSNMKVIAISDISYKKKSFQKDNIIFLKDYNDIFKLKLDVLFVCLPNRYASEATILGLKNNLHVFCEKPPGRTVNDIKKVIRVENKKPKLKLKYGFNHRYHDATIELEKMIKSKKYGKIINFRGVYGKSKIVSFAPSDWRSKKIEAGGGILLDQGIHMLDLINNLSDGFEKIHSFVSNKFWNYDVEDNAYAILQDKKGVVAMIHSTATQWQHKFRLEISLEKALIELTGILSSSKSYGKEKLKIIKRNKIGQNKDTNEIIKNYRHDKSWKREIDEFCDLILNNKKVVIGSSKDALQVMELIYKIYDADNTWSKVIKNKKEK